MNNLPKDLQDIIYEYKQQLEYISKFNKCIKEINNVEYEIYYDVSRRNVRGSEYRAVEYQYCTSNPGNCERYVYSWEYGNSVECWAVEDDEEYRHYGYHNLFCKENEEICTIDEYNNLGDNEGYCISFCNGY